MRKQFEVIAFDGTVKRILKGQTIKAVDGLVELVDIDPKGILAPEYFYVKTVYKLGPGESIQEARGDAFANEIVGERN